MSRSEATDGDRRLLAVARAGHLFAGCNSLDELLPLSGELAREVLQGCSASVARLEHDHGLLRVLHNVGELAEWEDKTPTDETYDLADFPLLAATVEDAGPRWGYGEHGETGVHDRDLLRRMGMASSISLPVIVGSTVWGEIAAARRDGRPRFGPGDLAAGEAFCGLLSAAIMRIEERVALHALAFNDALTGLGNRRAIDDRLEDLFAHERLEEPLSLIVCDVDGLKCINDTFGHEAGDRVLREVGAMLSRVAGSHPGTLAARQGGDEFCLLLVGASEEEVRATVEQLTTEARGLPLGAGLSCGWTQTVERPGDAPTASAAAQAVLRLADAAQYRTKRAGRAELIAVPTPETDEGITVRARVVDRVVAALHRSDGDVADRLRDVAVTLAAVANASAWGVSRSIDRGPVEVVTSHDLQRLGQRAEQVIPPGVAFAPQDYPATAAALAGGGFHATIDSGDEAERAFLAAYGYDEVIGAGAAEDARTAWLVEIVGDALTPSLAHLLPLLRCLVVLAVEGGAASS